MEQMAFSNLNKNDFLMQAGLASENHVAFANFVRDAEVFCEDGRSGVIDENLAQYRKIWFDLEVINALALDDWESEGKPANWLPQWEERYKNDAKEVIAELRVLLTSL